MLKIKLVVVGKMKEKFYIDAFNEYAKRLTPYCSLDVTEIQESSLEKESQAISKVTDKNAFVVAMAIEGKKLSSEQFAYCLRDLANKGKSEIVFIIGGSVGLSEQIKNNADMKLSMSDMTFPHHLARVMLIEQIYRSFKINEGSVYHK